MVISELITTLSREQISVFISHSDFDFFLYFEFRFHFLNEKTHLLISQFLDFLQFVQMIYLGFFFLSFFLGIIRLFNQCCCCFLSVFSCTSFFLLYNLLCLVKALDMLIQVSNYVAYFVNSFLSLEHLKPLRLSKLKHVLNKSIDFLLIKDFGKKNSSM